MKPFVFVLLLFAVFSAAAQDTLYHHFYDNVQMIEIRPKEVKATGRKNLSTDYRSAAPSIYLFRDRQDRWLAQYNTRGAELTRSAFLSPQQCLHRLVRHRGSSPRLTHLQHRYVLPASVGFYPVYRQHALPGQTMGVVDSMGRMVLPAEYVPVQLLDSFLVVQKDGKTGLLNRHFETVIPFAYTAIEQVKETGPFFRLWNEKQCGLADLQRHKTVEAKYEQIIPMTYHPRFINVCLNGKWGLIRWDGSTVIPCKYDRAFLFLHDGCVPLKRDGKFALVDTLGTERAEARYEKMEHLGSGYWRAYRDGLCVLLDHTGSEICVSAHEVIRCFAPGMFLVRDGNDRTGLYGICDNSGRLLWPLKYQSIGMCSPGRFIVALSGKDKDGVFDGNARWVLANEKGIHLSRLYEEMNLLSCGFISVRKNRQRGLIDTNGVERIKPGYVWVESWGDKKIYMGDYQAHYIVDPASIGQRSQAYAEKPSLRQGRARIKAGNRWGYLDSLGREVVAPQYDFITDYTNGIAAVRDGKYWKLIDRWGKQAVPQFFDFAEVANHNSGHLFVYSAGQKFLVTGLNRPLLPFPYEKVKPFYEGYYDVESGAKQGLIDAGGAVVLPPDFESVRKINGVLLVSQNGLYGCYERDGQLLIPALYEELMPVSTEVFWAKKNARWGFLDRTGKVLVPFMFDDPVPSFAHRYNLGLDETYLAQAQRMFRDSIEYWYITLDGLVAGKKKVANTQRGFSNIYKRTGGNHVLYGVRNWKADTVIPCRYNHIGQLENNLYFEVTLNGRKGMADTTGREVVPLLYDAVDAFRGTPLVLVRSGKRYGLYHHRKGKLFDVTCNGFTQQPGNLVSYSTGGTYNEQRGFYEGGLMGLLDQEGQVLVEPRYDYIWVMGAAGIVIASKGDEMCVLDKKGNIISGMVKCKTAAERWKMYKAG